MLDIRQLRTLIIAPALEAIDLYSLAAEEQVLGTGLHESHLKYLKQIGGGPAIGLWQMEPVTHDDIWDTYLRYRPNLAQKVRRLLPTGAETSLADQMAGNLWYAAAMCRLRYYRVNDPLPDAGDLEWQAAYWKAHYNTHKGKGTVAQYIETWNRYMT